MKNEECIELFSFHKQVPVDKALNTEITLKSSLKPALTNPVALRKAKIVYNFGLSECNRVKAVKIRE